MTETITLPVDLARRLAAVLPASPDAAELTALIPEPDEAQETLARALGAMAQSNCADSVRRCEHPVAVAIIRDAMKPKMTPKIAADFAMARQAVFVDNCYAALDRIEAQFRGEGK